MIMGTMCSTSANSSPFPSLKSKRWNFWTGKPLSLLTGKSEGAVARQELDGRSKRAGTLGVTPGATSRDESATDLQSSRQNDSLSGLKECGGKNIETPSVRTVSNEASPLCRNKMTPEQLEKWWHKVCFLLLLLLKYWDLALKTSSWTSREILVPIKESNSKYAQSFCLLCFNLKCKLP